MKLGASCYALLLAACTIDPVARAELSGAVTGDAIFQQAGTSDQVSYQLTLAGPDGSYQVFLSALGCGAPDRAAKGMGNIEIVDGLGALRGVTQDWSVASDDADDIVGGAIVVERGPAIESCGEIFNSD